MEILGQAVFQKMGLCVHTSCEIDVPMTDTASPTGASNVEGDNPGAPSSTGAAASQNLAPEVKEEPITSTPVSEANSTTAVRNYNP